MEHIKNILTGLSFIIGCLFAAAIVVLPIFLERMYNSELFFLLYLLIVIPVAWALGNDIRQ